MKLYRSKKDKKLLGLCGGLAESLDVDATLLRVVFLVTAFFSAGTTIVIYFLASFVIPKETDVLEPTYGFSETGFSGSGFAGSGYSADGYTATMNPGYQHYSTFKDEEAELDKLMADMEKKALHKEIEELKQKLAKYEKGAE